MCLCVARVCVCLCLCCVTAICGQVKPDGWTFVPYKDQAGNDLGNIGGLSGNWTLLAAACDTPWLSTQLASHASRH